MPPNPLPVNELFPIGTIFVKIPPPGRSDITEGPATPQAAGPLDTLGVLLHTVGLPRQCLDFLWTHGPVVDANIVDKAPEEGIGSEIRSNTNV